MGTDILRTLAGLGARSTRSTDIESRQVTERASGIFKFAQVRSIQLHRLTSWQDKQNKAANEIAISHIKPRDEAGSFWSSRGQSEEKSRNVQDHRRGPLGRSAGRRGLRPDDPGRPHRRLLCRHVGQLQVRLSSRFTFHLLFDPL